MSLKRVLRGGFNSPAIQLGSPQSLANRISNEIRYGSDCGRPSPESSLEASFPTLPGLGGLSHDGCEG